MTGSYHRTLTGQMRYEPGRLPQVDELVARAARRLTRGRPHVCGHLTSGREPVAFVCAHHPAAGVLCHDCFIAHADRHPAALEHDCDQCGKVAPVPLMVLVVPTAGVIAGRNPRRGRGLLVGDVHLGGLGICGPCWGRAASQVAA